MPLSFFEKLRAAQETNHSWLCVGLDPVAHPHTNRTDPDGLRVFCEAIVEATADLVSAYKPNLGFFLAHGGAGIDALAALIKQIPTHIPIILDAKFGDMGSTQRQYRKFAFETLAVDAVTLSPYLGTEALTPFLAAPDDATSGATPHGIFVLCRTSNVDQNEFQTLGSPPLFEFVAQKMAQLGEKSPGAVGLVVGATQTSAEMAAIRASAPKLPFLIPGVGTQGGSPENAVKHGVTSEGIGPVISVSRDILYAERGANFAEAARKQAIVYRDRINAARITP